MYKKEPDLVKIIMATILGFILLFCLVFYGCSRTRQLIRPEDASRIFNVITVSDSLNRWQATTKFWTIELKIITDQGYCEFEGTGNTLERAIMNLADTAFCQETEK